LAAVDDLLQQNREALGRLIDLYLSGEFSRDALAKRKTGLEETIADLGRERMAIDAKLAQGKLTEEQMLTFTEFAQNVATSLDTMEESFGERRRLIDLLDLRVSLAVEDGAKYVHAECILDEAVLPLVDPTAGS
jgi:hypothetical protein